MQSRLVVEIYPSSLSSEAALLPPAARGQFWSSAQDSLLTLLQMSCYQLSIWHSSHQSSSFKAKLMVASRLLNKALSWFDLTFGAKARVARVCPCASCTGGMEPPAPGWPQPYTRTHAMGHRKAVRQGWVPQGCKTLTSNCRGRGSASSWVSKTRHRNKQALSKPCSSALPGHTNPMCHRCWAGPMFYTKHVSGLFSPLHFLITILCLRCLNVLNELLRMLEAFISAHRQFIVYPF